MTGEVGILNVGLGDVKLSFDPSNPAECIRAARIVKDMLRRGYAILIADGGQDANGNKTYSRCKAFDEKTFEYIIADFDPEEAAASDMAEKVAALVRSTTTRETAEEYDAEMEQQGAQVEQETAGSSSTEERAKAAKPRGRGKGGKTRRVKAGETSAISVARSAGG